MSTPAEQGLDGALLETLDAAIRRGNYGNVDHLLVVRRDFLVHNRQYGNNYAEFSRGFVGPFGCGQDACTEGQEDDLFNYYHPSTHPFYHGRAVHSLQSVTKSVAATVIGVALRRGDIDSLDAPLLSFFDNYDTQDVDTRLRAATLEDLPPRVPA